MAVRESEHIMKIPVKADTFEYEVVINAVRCDFCDRPEFPALAHYYEDQTVCEACYDRFNERWE